MKTLVHWWSLKTLVHCHGSESNSHVQRLTKYSVKEIYCHYCDKANHLTAFCLKNKQGSIREKNIFCTFLIGDCCFKINKTKNDFVILDEKRLLLWSVMMYYATINSSGVDQCYQLWILMLNHPLFMFLLMDYEKHWS